MLRNPSGLQKTSKIQEKLRKVLGWKAWRCYWSCLHYQNTLSDHQSGARVKCQDETQQAVMYLQSEHIDQCNRTTWCSLQSDKAQRRMEIRVEWWVTHATFNQSNLHFVRLDERGEHDKVAESDDVGRESVAYRVLKQRQSRLKWFMFEKAWKSWPTGTVRERGNVRRRKGEAAFQTRRQKLAMHTGRRKTGSEAPAGTGGKIYGRHQG